MDDITSNTQKIDWGDPLPARCIEHMRRLDKMEGRMDAVEKRIVGIEELKTLVQLLADRIRLILWMTGVATSGIVLGLIGMFLAHLQG